MKYTLKQKIYISLSAAALVGIMVVIFKLSHQTATESSETSGSLIAWIYSVLGLIFSQDTIRTLAHLCEFGLFGFLTTNFVFSHTNKTKPVISIIFAFLYAFSDEIHQLFIDGRAFQFSDLIVDLSGIIIGTALFTLIIFAIKKLTDSKDRKQTETALATNK